MTSTAMALTPTPAPATEAPTIAITPATALPTITPTPQPGYSFARIRFLEPGPASKIVSPLNLQMIAIIGKSETIQIDLFGEDGRVLFTQITQLNYYPEGTYQSFKIPFEIRAAAEKGILQISTRDKNGQLEALNTLDVFLLSAGVDQNNPPGNIIYERVALTSPPVKDASASGGIVNVSGTIWPFDEPDHTLFLELSAPDGRVIGSRIVALNGTEPQSFSTTLIYKIKEPTTALITIKQMSAVLDTPVYVYTQSILLMP